MNILITSGATREPIDDVRFLSNISTGSTGAALAAALAARGHTITLLHGHSATLPPHLPPTGAAAPHFDVGCSMLDVGRSGRSPVLIPFGSTDDLRAQLRAQLGTGTYDAIIHCAAVSDYRPSAVQPGKMTSYADELTLHLVPTPKLLPELKSYVPRGAGVPPGVGASLATPAPAGQIYQIPETQSQAETQTETQLRASQAKPLHRSGAGVPPAIVAPQRAAGVSPAPISAPAGSDFDVGRSTLDVERSG
ncbi:phosphopantothenoylcysteine decarboxylase, partial [Geminisphaera colitermitum]|uniref:phosphopantothenoylcysteine decarboxylase domain-containing protein n=1 Tax=Geminisphaera colitermitum TaxID=1148786 RepID=UPI000693DDFB